MEKQFEQDFHQRLKRHHRNTGFKWAIVLILIGFIALASNMGIIATNYRQIIFSWGMLALIVGFFLFVKRFPYFTFWGWMWMCIGAFFLIPKFHSPLLGWNLPENFTHTYSPILLIIAGILILLKWVLPKPAMNHHFFIRKHFMGKRFFRGRNHPFYNEPMDRQTPFNTYKNFDDNLMNVTFGSKKHIVLDKEFKGGNINTIFGEIILDLRKTQLIQEITYLQVDITCGSATIFVPATWKVEWKGTTTFGEFSDKRDISNATLDTSKQLIINGTCTFGNIQLIL